jgi:hypothetical protein
MNISKNIIKYLNKNNWNLIFEDENLLHYTKLNDLTVYHLYIQYLKNCDEYQVELGQGETQDNSELFKLRNLVSILKKRNI